MEWIPRACPVCGSIAAPNSLFCPECGKYALRLRRTCDVCGSFLPTPESECHFCAAFGSHYVDAFFSPYIYAGSISSVITAMKYQGNAGLASVLGKELARHVPDTYADADSIVHPPMSTLEQLKRGFNQSAVFAEHLSARYRIPVLFGAIKKVKKTAKQASLSGKARTINVSGAFEITEKSDIHGTVIIVDDVITTGSTVNHIAKQLKQAGAHTVYAVSLARTSLFFS